MNFFKRKKYVTLLRVTGVIQARGRGSLSIETLKPLIKEAFSKHACAVALVINSPGGAPVQTDLIAREIRHLSNEKKIPVYTFCEDVAASGGYWLLCSGDEIYAMPSSIVGSIGVLFSGFGFVDILKKLGIERRVYTAGSQKAQLDPFLPICQEAVGHLQEVQREIHEQFIAYVKERRGNKLKADESIFSGNFWVATRALNLGLIDDIGDPETILHKKFGQHIKIKEISPPKSWLKNKLGLLISFLYAESLWQRIGL